MARAENTEFIDLFEEFYRDYYRNEIGDLAQKYPNERKSLFVDYQDLYRFDPDLAGDYRNKPEQLQEYAEEALRLFDLPIDVKLGQAHVRMTNLPESTDIREIRADHRGQLVSIQGIIRKATEVRPKITDAAFECQRCGTLTRIPQSTGDFQEPHECQGCERQGPFRINFDQSEFIDAQKLRVQESPEGLRGGETPQNIDVNIEDDITGEVTAGDHVRVTGILKLDQRGNDREQSPMFDVYMDGVDVEIEDEEFEEMDIDEDDKKEIVALSEEQDIYEQMTASIAPSIYGYDQEKLAIALQLFSGVTKHLPDESRIRGDLHVLLIGDPGTGKCVKFDTNVRLADGTTKAIGELVEANLDDPKPVDDGVWDHASIPLPTLAPDGTLSTAEATKVWKREAPDHLYRIRTESGRELDVTPSHPLFVQQNGQPTAMEAEKLEEEQFVATPRSVPTAGDDRIEVDHRESQSPNAVRFSAPETWTPSLARLVGYVVAEGHVQYRADNTADLRITNEDDPVLEDARAAFEALDLPHSEDVREESGVTRLRCHSSEFVSFLESIEPAILENSAQQRVPEEIKRASDPIRRAFLRAYVEGEGHVAASERELTVASMSEALLEDVRGLLTSFGIDASIHERVNGSYRLRISGDDFGDYISEVGFVTDRKQLAAESYEGTTGNTNRDVVPISGDTLREVRESLALTQTDCNVPRTTYQHYERGDRNPSRESLRAVVDAFEERLAWLKDQREGLAGEDWETIVELRDELGISQQSLADGMDVTQTAVSYYERNEVAPDGGETVAASAVVRDRLEEALAVESTVDRLGDLATNDVRWDRIASIEMVEPDDEWVYDLEVEGTHSYVSNGVVSHNSQILQYIRHIAPRSVFTSGKGSSSAGLCVTGDTRIQTEDGFRQIRDLVTEELPEPVATETAAERAIDVQTFDREDGEIDARASSHVWRMPEKPTRRIETEYGKELEASVNTPVLTCGDEGIEWTEISEIEAGDYIAAPRFGDLDRSEVDVREFLTLSTEKVKLTEESIEFLRTELTEEFGTLRDAAATLDLSEDFIYAHLKNRHVPLEKLDRMLEAIDATRSDVDFERLMVRHGDSITVPETFDADLMYLLGLVFGDGDISLDRRDGNRGMVRISNGNERLLERAADIFEAKFDKRPEIERQDDRVPCIRVNSVTIARLFENAGMESPKEGLALAPELTVAEHGDAFLRGLMDADGSVSVRGEKGGSSVLLSTISETLGEQVQLMLESYGVKARLRERDRRGTFELANGHEIESSHVQYYVEMYGAEIDRYAEAIGFESVEKATALEEIVREERRQREKIPVGSALAAVEGVAGDYYQNVNRGDDPGRARARSMLADIDLGPVEPLVEEAVEADLRWEEVVAAVDTGEKEVFDLTVPGTHNFLGNGLVTHNTAAAVRDDFGDGQQWTLEAGALVLADRGIAAVDELDKMRCVTGNTLVRLGNGRISRIRELAREAAIDGEIEPHANGRTIRDVDFEAWTMTDDGRLAKRPVTAIHEYEAPDDLATVTLESGEELTATRDHPFFAFENGERIEKPAADLEPGDWVYVPRSIPTSVTDGGVAASPVSTERDTGTPSPALAAVLGYLSGDGNVYYDRQAGVYGIRFTNKEEQLLADFERNCREAFDVEPTRPPSEQRDDGVETVRVPGQEYADAVVDAGMNLETYDEKAFPDGVTEGSADAKAAFVRALADSEGNVDTSTGNVRIFSASYELLLGTKQLLQEFGVSSQIQTRERAGKRDLYILAITAADSLAAFARHVGFTLDRKRAALDEVCEEVSGERTILDVIPECGDLLADIRESLRLHQSECGIDDATYCNFENGDANVSIRLSKQILAAFEERTERAATDSETLASDPTWERLTEIKARYHVSQAEIADGTRYTQQRISREWGESDELRRIVANRLFEMVRAVEDTQIEPFRTLVRGDVRWRRVDAVESDVPGVPSDTVNLYRGELADLLNCPPRDAVDRAHDLLATKLSTENWSQLQEELDRSGVSHSELARDLGVDQSTVSRWFNGTVETDSFDEVCTVARTRIEAIRDEAERLLAEVETAQKSKVYDLTVEGTHNFLANGMVVHNSEDRSAMHEALEQQSYHPDSELLLADGRRVEIGDFVDERMAERSDDVIDGVDCEILPVEDVRVHSADLDDNDVQKLSVDRVSRHEAPEEFVRVSFSNGREVVVTPEHPMFVESDDEWDTVPASETSAGTPVPVPVAVDGGAVAQSPGSATGIGTETITDVETLPNEGEHATDWVYDVTVEPTNTFVSQGVILHNSISISKAGINATLKSRCSLLGAANPKYGRFDQYEPIGEQIDLEPALISRFDLIFTVTDQPDEEEDAKLAEHILRTNYAGELNTHRQQNSTPDYSAEEVDNVTETVAPEIDPELLRKYVAYAKRSCFPTMTEEAKAAIRDFYVELRTKGSGEDAPVPVTARKLEALVRLAEASARVRLSDTVEAEDAERVIGIVRSSLEDIGIDPETGELDADVVETGTSKSQRDRIKNIRGIISDIEEEYDEGAPVDVVIERAEEVGMEASKAEHEIEKLKQQGEVYEPRTDHLRTT
ncbi:helix-turn-helix domain-containing protein [Halorhabdus sp. CBA1104]|uniref:LAGLIDADG family homing endonuclease n=1 Tax=Halorhabdus sp. CBA1104 TaxID=1380432 RepID=UPI0012B21110|nr:LAGLIDADG family homing endonuclease [Halorhabdus sp. CBA1104]QGN07900.1 helix-turn-helix domain-containing protein [Halorhabdus sp. CBA1104]